MARKEKETLASLFSGLRDTLKANASAEVRHIPNILEFVEDPEYLGLSHPLYPIQRLILKAFYRGSEGNENLTFDDDEIEYLRECGLDKASPDYNDRGDVVGKINTKTHFRELVLVWGRRCVSGDTKIVDPQTGKVWKISDLWRHEKLIDSWTYDENTGKMVSIKDCGAIHQGIRPVFRLITSSGHEIEATDNHPFLTPRGWVELKDLRVGEDEVAITESVPFFGTSDAISEDEAVVLGYMTGDGNCSQRTANFTCANSEMLADFTSRLHCISDNLSIVKDKWTKAKSKDYQYKIYSTRIDSENFKKDGSVRTYTRRKTNDLVNLLTKHGLMGKTCHHKCVPDALYECPQKVVAAYLRALFSCDGSLNLKKGRRQIEFEFTTVNKKQAEDVQHLLSRFGIMAFLRRKQQTTHVRSEGKTYIDHVSYRVVFSRKKYLEIFDNQIGFVGRNVLSKTLKERLLLINADNEALPYVWQKISSVESCGEKDTFDLQVSADKNTQNYTGQGVISHNSGKDYIASIIALYEAMKLLESPGGDPYKRYNLPRGGNPITILTVATAAPQAAIAFSEMKAKLLQSKYFKNKFINEGLGAQSLHLLTPADRQENEERKKRGLKPEKGGIVIRAGHSNSDSLLGIQCYVLLMDEVASFHQTDGSSGGHRVYEAMLPSLNTFACNTPVFDELGQPVLEANGKQKTIQTYDSKIISISSPRGKEGILYEMFKSADAQPDRLVCRLPTWIVAATRFTREALRKSFSQFNEESFMMEFGAEFSATAGMNFFVEERVNSCFNRSLPFRKGGQAGIIYYAHLDPATTNNNYALAVVHKELMKNTANGRAEYMVILDHLQVWSPKFDGKRVQPVMVQQVEKYLMALNRVFHIGLTTYDQFNSMSTLASLRKIGMPCKMTHYSKPYKMQIYTELEKLINEHRIIMPYDDLLYNELINLQRRYDSGRGFSILPNKESDCSTDDCCVSPDTIVPTNRGHIPIVQVEIGDKVLTHVGTWKRVEAVIQHKPKGQCYKIKTFYGTDLKATGNHPIEVFENAERTWKRIDEIKKGDLIVRASPHRSNMSFCTDLAELVETPECDNHKVRWIIKDKIKDRNPNAKWLRRFVKPTKEWGYLVGAYAAEGFLQDHGIAFSINKNEHEFRDTIVKCLYDVFGIEKIHESVRTNARCITCNNTIVKTYFSKLFGQAMAIDKEIPICVYDLKPMIQKEVLRGYFDGDGSSSPKAITFTTASEKMMHSLQLLLMQNDILSSISISRRKGTICHIRGREVRHNADLLNVRICEASSFNAMSKVLKLNVVKTQSKYHIPHFKKLSGNAIGCAVKDVEITDLDIVCNLEVETEHSYIANGLNAHNSDALAGAVYNCLETSQSGLPHAKLVSMPTSGGMRQWNSMSGPLGFGSGQQVAHFINRGPSITAR